MTRVPGHTLAFEGAPHDAAGVRVAILTGGAGRAKCSCGQLSRDLVSSTARKQWHREHKADVSSDGNPGR